MSRVYWDSMLFIYWIENNPAFQPKVDLLFQTSRLHADHLYTSIFTVGEVLAGPVRTQDKVQQARIEALFDVGPFTLIPITREAVRIFAALRATSRITPADAIHLACAAAHGVDIFYTNDKALLRLSIPGIGKIALLS